MDEGLRQALAKANGRVVLPVFRQHALGNGHAGDIVYTAPLPMFRQLVSIGSVNAMPEPDGLVRRQSATDYWEDGLHVRQAPRLRRFLDQITFGRTVPTMAALLASPARPLFDVFHLDFGIRPETFPRLSYADVVEGSFDPAVVKGRKVIVGATAVELGDQFATPVYKSLSGPILQAMSYESIIQGRTLYRSAPWMVYAGILIVGLLFARRFHAWSWRWGMVALVLMILSFAGASLALQMRTPLMLEVTPWILLATLLYVSSLNAQIDNQGLQLMFRGIRQRRGNALMRSVVESSSDAILTMTEEMLVEVANPAAEAIFGVQSGALAGQRVEELLPELGDDSATLESLLSTGAAEIEGINAEGTPIQLELTVSDMEVGGRRRFVVMARDISDRKAQQRLLEYLALHDPLTGLPNRALLMDRLEHAISVAERQEQTMALLLLDLDRFKEINDTLGHAVGDSLLTEVGRVLAEPLRASDTIARLGGDEFAVLLPSVLGAKQANEIAERVAMAMQRPFLVDDLTLEVGVSIGIALYPDHGTDASQLLRSADVAMYVAKKDRSVFSTYDPSKDDNSVRNLAMSGELRAAMDTDQLVLYYQPKIDLATHRLTGAEALVRWRHPSYGLVPPDDFISLAEQSGMIRQLSRWVLDKSVRQLEAWHKDGLEISMAVNLSPRNLHEEDLTDAVEALLRAHPVGPEYLTLEITENAIMVDPPRVLEAIRQLKATGVRLSIDDFGTGYSSLAYLKNLPVDEIKIDKSFVVNMAEDKNDEVIVRATIDLAHNLGLVVVGEGVEGVPQMRALEALGCDFAQGFHIAKPMPVDKFMEWLHTNTRLVAAGTSTPAGRYLLQEPPMLAALGS